MSRPFRTPLYPYLPACALLLALLCLLAVAWSARGPLLVFVALLAAGSLLRLRDRP
jgi:ethanolamine permease